MTRKPSLTLPLVLIALLVAGSLLVIVKSAAAEACVRDESAVLDVLASHLKAVQARDLEDILAVYSPGARLVGADQIFAGEDTREHYETAFLAADLEPDNSVDQVEVHEDWALIEGRYRDTVVPRDGGPSAIYPGSYVLLLACDRAGAWKFHRVMWWQD